MVLSPASQHHILARKNVKITDPIPWQLQFLLGSLPIQYLGNPGQPTDEGGHLDSIEGIGKMHRHGRTERTMVSHVRIGDGADHPHSLTEVLRQHRLEMNDIGRAVGIHLEVHAMICCRCDHTIEIK